MRHQAVLLVCALLGALSIGGRATGAAALAPMSIRIHVSGAVNLDRLEQYAADLHDTGCTLIRNYASPGQPHTYTLTINEAGRHFGRDTLYLQVEPYHHGQTVYVGLHSGRVQWFTQQSGKGITVTSLPLPGAHFQVRLSPDLHSGTVEATHTMATIGGQVGLTAALSASWTCPVLFQEHYG